MKEVFPRMLDRMRYPSSQDGKEVLGKLVAPSALLGLASTLHRVAPAESDLVANLGTEQATSASDLLKKAKFVAIPGLVAGGLLFMAISYQEYKNRMHFGDNLTVSKVAPAKSYIPRILFPQQLQNERFVGELHFKGKWKMRYSP